MDYVAIVQTDGSIVLRIPVEEIPTDALPTQVADYPGATAYHVDPSTLPGSCRDAWTWLDGAIVVDIDRARTQRAAALQAAATTLAGRLAQAALPHLLTGDTEGVAKLTGLRTAVLAMPDLSAVTEPAAIAAFEPAAFAEARAALA